MTAATDGGERFSDGSSRRSRAGRTLVALLAVGSVAVTAAGAHPLDGGTDPRPNDVFAVGQGGLGSIDLLALEEADAGSRRGDVRPGDGRGGATGPSDVSTGAAAGLPVEGVTVELPGFGAEPFASLLPAVPAARAGSGGRAGIPGPTLRAYRAAAEVLAREAPGCGIDWALLAGIGHVETGHGRFGGAVVDEQGVSAPGIFGPRLDGSLAGTMVIRDTDGGTLDGDASYDRAVGPMQFIPGTWKRWGSDGDRDGTAQPQDIDDAALAAARYLCAGTTGVGDPGQAARAVRRYNNSSSYVAQVLALAEGYRSGTWPGAPGAGDGSASPSSPPPPGWTLPPGTVVGAGPLVATEPSAPADVSSVTDEPGAATPSSPPSGEPSGGATEPVSPEPSASPTEEPSAAPSGEPSGSPTASPTATAPATSETAPSEPAASEPAASEPAPTEPAPTCGPAPTVEPGADPALQPCPVPCEGTSATTEPVVEPTATATCLPQPSGTP